MVSKKLGASRVVLGKVDCDEQGKAHFLAVSECYKLDRGIGYEWVVSLMTEPTELVLPLSLPSLVFKCKPFIVGLSCSCGVDSAF